VILDQNDLKHPPPPPHPTPTIGERKTKLRKKKLGIGRNMVTFFLITNIFAGQCYYAILISFAINSVCNEKRI
jgi:hypothetical protein